MHRALIRWVAGVASDLGNVSRIPLDVLRAFADIRWKGPLFAFGGVEGYVRDGHVVEMNIAESADAETLFFTLYALAANFGVTHAHVDLLDENALREWLGLKPAPTPDEALAEARAGRVSDLTLRIALQHEDCEDILEARGRARPARHAPVGERDLTKLSHFSMAFNGYDLLGTKLSVFANAAKKRWEEEKKLPKTVTGARACLFFECRRRVHQAATVDDWEYIDGLLRVARGRALQGGNEDSDV